jgi:hypothetical protein
LDSAFLLRPTPGQDVDLIDGVCFSFDLNLFPQLPGKILIFQRSIIGGAPWQLIGAITDFDDIDNIKFVHGGVAWVPAVEGNYEVRADVVDTGGMIIGRAVRTVAVGRNQAPMVTITGAPSTPSASAQPAVFSTTITDPEMDQIRRVEFFAGGRLIGADREAPFGDMVRDLENNAYNLERGRHSITARAYDSRGAVGISAPVLINITAGNHRPEVNIVSPPEGVIVEQRQSLQLSSTVTDPDGPGDLAKAEFHDLLDISQRGEQSFPFAPLTIDTTSWQLGTHTLRISSTDLSGLTSYPTYFRVFMTGISGLSFAERLVPSIVDDTAAAFTNAVFQGIEASREVFANGLESGLQIARGVLLTTGDDGFDEDFEKKVWNQQGDAELETRVSGILTRDAAALEFDIFCPNRPI